MIALSAEPFRTTGVNPRVHDRDGPTRQPDQAILRPVSEPPKFRSALRNEGECGEFLLFENLPYVFFKLTLFFVYFPDTAASECKTLAKDFWSRGYNRWLVSRRLLPSFFREKLTFPVVAPDRSDCTCDVLNVDIYPSPSPLDPPPRQSFPRRPQICFRSFETSLPTQDQLVVAGMECT